MPVQIPLDSLAKRRDASPYQMMLYFSLFRWLGDWKEALRCSNIMVHSVFEEAMPVRRQTVGRSRSRRNVLSRGVGSGHSYIYRALSVFQIVKVDVTDSN